MRESKGVSFNVDDPFEYKLLLFALQQGAFSKYIKRLIQRDMEGVSIPASQPIQDQVIKQFDSPGIADSFI
ncbi:hypothetical protein [Metabacillus bambusae]|uniref:Uncharacterized protein n=1 Tax=Metabacillus bambusae TaxID=2795218 RepID=A0ABS3NBK0_9BACI|nr:hypothetical protein [Metabacillus bambusae]MBO1515659.1 hypothetical protein [Metabacillus bambusae]